MSPIARKRFFTVIKHLGLIILTFIMFFPLYIVFVMGTYYSEDIFRGMPIWFSDYLMENIKVVFKNDFGTAYLNSIIVSVGSVVLSVLTSSLIGFALAKYRFKIKNFIFSFMVLMMMIPGQVSIIGYVLEMKAFNMLGTLLPLIFIWMAHPFGAFFMTQFIRDSVPDEVLESGRLDGCSEPGLFFRIVLPFVRSALVTLSMLVFLWAWNSYMIPLIVINKQSLYTIPLMVSNLSTAFRTDYGAIMCALSISILPIILLFCLASKTFIKGIAAGAVKG